MTTLAFAAGAAVGYYIGSRPRAQALAEVRHAGLTGVQYANYARHRVAEIRDDHRSMSEQDEDWPLTPPTRSTDWDISLLAEDDALDEMGRESFPSSDPPSTWAGSDDSFPRGARH